MLTVFDRRALLITCDLKRCSALRDALDGAGIQHRCRVKDLTRRTAGRRGTIGIQESHRMEYTVFVAPKDYERAKTLL